MRARLVCLGVVLLLGCSGGAGPADGAVDGSTLIPVGVETVAPASVRAGQTLAVSCVLVDAMGETFAAPPELEPTLRFVPDTSVERAEDGTWFATRAGEVEVACAFSELRMTDDSPSVVEVLPGDPARTVARVAPDSMPAGAETVVDCDVYDAWGNLVEDAEPTRRAEPSDGSNTFDGPYGQFLHAGRFDVYCDLAGAESRGALLEVYPNVPASLVLARVPDQPVYGIGQTIEIERLVHDRFGNLVTDVEVPTVSEPGGQELGEGRYRYLADGLYTVTATVSPPTEGDVPIVASTEILVDGSGPAIGCDGPTDGEIVNVAPGSHITFRGSVSDLTGVRTVRVNGTPIAIGEDGTFLTPLVTQYGINFVDLAAVDGSGREASRTCAFLVADTWAPDDRTASDSLSLRLRQDAFDDSNRGDGLDSLADVLHTVLNSRGLRDQLHSALLAANPLKPSSCDQGGPFGTCLLRSEVIYRNSEIRGPNTASLTLVDGGLRAAVHVENLRIQVRIHGSIAGIGYDTTGWVTFSSADVGLTFDASLAAGRPRVSVRPGSVSVSVGSISTDFSGLDGAIVDVAVSLFNGTVRTLVANTLRDWVTSNFDGVLDGVLGGLDIESLGTSFDVPRLDSSESIPLSFNVGFSSLGTTSSRMLFGTATRFSAPPAHARPTLGAPVRSGARLLDAGGTGSTAVAVHELVMEQAIHALWRGGFFDATLGSAILGGDLPAGLEATMTTGLPPVVQLRTDGRTELALGAVTLVLRYPDLFAEPIVMTLGARASMAVALSGEDLTFSDVRIEELYFSTGLTSLDMGTRDTIEGFLQRLLQRVVYSALEGALPSLPIPSFTLPSSLSTYGLPAGAELGIVSPSLSPEPPHFVLRGNFAVR